MAVTRIEPIEDQVGFLHNFEQQERLVSKGHHCDEVIFGLKKFAALAANCNPNVIEVLFVDDSDVLFESLEGAVLRDHRDLFLTKRAEHTFSGYAHAQLKRIKNHRGWLLNPPKEPPKRTAFGLAGDRPVGKDVLGAFDALDPNIAVPKDILTLLLREKQYAAAKMHWDQYQNWVKTRNPTRAKYEALWGYDTKHAMHLIRLQRMALEIGSGLGCQVRRSDAKQLLEIRNGAWCYGELIMESERLDAECKVVYANSKLPKKPDRVTLNNLVVDLTIAHDKRLRQSSGTPSSSKRSRLLEESGIFPSSRIGA